jgi:hypothetical protein
MTGPFSGALFFCAVFALLPGFVQAQSSGAVSQSVLTGAEIQSIEKNLGKTGLSGVERRGLLIRLAQIQELTGNIEAAAQNWAAAAAAEPGKRDDLSLIKGALCLAAMGEWDRAGAAAKTVLLTGQAGPALLLARYLGAQVEAFGSGDLAALTALADNPDFVSLRPAIYYTLWNINGAAPERAEGWKNRLITEFPQSPEGRIAAGAGGAVEALPAPLWVFFPGRGGVALEAAAPSGTSVSAAPSAPAAPASPAPGRGVLQTGLFGTEANARKQAERLRAAGFTPAVTKRLVNGTEYWTVNVPPGQNMSQTILKLKDAGFESFPVF